MFLHTTYVRGKLYVGGSITVWLVSSLTRLDLTKKENMWLLVCSESAESKLVKLETSTEVILDPTMSVLWFYYTSLRSARARNLGYRKWYDATSAKKGTRKWPSFHRTLLEQISNGRLHSSVALIERTSAKRCTSSETTCLGERERDCLSERERKVERKGWQSLYIPIR